MIWNVINYSLNDLMTLKLRNLIAKIKTINYFTIKCHHQKVMTKLFLSKCDYQNYGCQTFGFSPDCPAFGLLKLALPYIKSMTFWESKHLFVRLCYDRNLVLVNKIHHLQMHLQKYHRHHVATLTQTLTTTKLKFIRLLIKVLKLTFEINFYK